MFWKKRKKEKVKYDVASENLAVPEVHTGEVEPVSYTHLDVYKRQAHSRTKNLADVTRRADILIVAIGKERFITSDYVKKGAVVIDVGMHRDAENHLCGDVDFADVEPVASAITPVPGGVGPVSYTHLDVYKRQPLY